MLPVRKRLFLGLLAAGFGLGLSAVALDEPHVRYCLADLSIAGGRYHVMYSAWNTNMLSIENVALRIDLYVLKNGLPTSSEGLAAVYAPEASPKDVWDYEFVYVTPGPNGRSYDVISYGCDGRPGANPQGLFREVKPCSHDVRLSDLRENAY